MPTTPSTLSAELTMQRDEILALCDGLSDAARTRAITNKGWNAQDFVGHLSSSEQDTLEQITQTFQEGRPRPMPPDTTVDEMNAHAMEKRKAWTWDRMRAEFVNTRNALIQRVDAMRESDLEFSVLSPWRNDTRIISLETLIREDVLEHGQEHLEELKTWQQQNSPSPKRDA